VNRYTKTDEIVRIEEAGMLTYSPEDFFTGSPGRSAVVNP
jgi:hypothetical protein